MSQSLVRVLISSLLLLVLCVTCSSDRGGGPNDPPDDPDPTGGNLIWIDSVDASPGTQAVIDVYARLSTATQAVTLPFVLEGTDFVIDSMSFVGTLLDNDPIWLYDSITPKTITIGMAYYQKDAVGPDSGQMLRLFVSLDESAPNQIIRVDTTSIILENGSVASLVLVDTTINPYPKEYIPEFLPGTIRVTDQPVLSF
ncbi:MAG: hypothetical protein ABIK83_05305 [Candidatus Zixiibacteriota bacterium]